MNNRLFFFTACIKPVRLFLIFILNLLSPAINAQPFSFAHVTDTHVGGATGAEDLERTVADLNQLPDIEFVLLTGDVTEFGTGEELSKAKSILDQLRNPYYVVPGNHDSKWSESGCNDFVRIFGSETFALEKHGILFIGTASGPNMRMAPALIPREQMLFLDSAMARLESPGQPIIFINHYSLDESLSNSQRVINLFQTHNIQVVLLGHGHTNKILDFEGIPGIMGRSNLRASKETGGYNICTVRNDSLFYTERVVGQKTLPVWFKMALHPLAKKFIASTRSIPDHFINADSATVREIWNYQEDSDIGSGIVSKGRICVYAGTGGQIIARDIRNGSVLWQYQTGGKIFSTPAIRGKYVVCPSTDGIIRCFDIRSGKEIWAHRTERPIVASPVVKNHRVFVGSSDGIFRALRLKDGQLLWHYDGIKNFVETRPLLYKQAVYFGSWGNSFYALGQKSGALLWKREKYVNRMLSPAAVWPVASGGKVFIVAPDRRFTALEAKTGREIWDSGKYSCRESIGMSKNKKLVFIKNMTEGNVDAFYTSSDTLNLAWECRAGLGYEIAPSPIVEENKTVFVPTTSGIIYAIGGKSHEVEWKFRVSESLINCILPISKHRLLVTAFDGKVACLRY